MWSWNDFVFIQYEKNVMSLKFWQIERCHSISNFGLQSVGKMRESMDPESERIIRNLNSNLEIRNAFENNPELKEKIEQNLRPTKFISYSIGLSVSKEV